MTTPSWHLDKAMESLSRWYAREQDWLTLAYQCKRSWFFSGEKECLQLALKCKTLGLVFHDRYKLILEDKE